MMQQLIVINQKDNVATATVDLQKGQEIAVETSSETFIITLQADIKFGHKVAIKDIKKGSPVYKYGEEIGITTEDIAMGEHVHVQNVLSQRGRGDLRN
ncbi:MAG: UxaA family hydrolase [Clostridia bacterium]|nr:UxaA family hydrolase [Clostridia bacterium]